MAICTTTQMFQERQELDTHTFTICAMLQSTAHSQQSNMAQECIMTMSHSERCAMNSQGREMKIPLVFVAQGESKSFLEFSEKNEMTVLL